MKKFILALVIGLIASSSFLVARGHDGDYDGKKKGYHQSEIRRGLFDPPEQGKLRNDLAGEVLKVAAEVPGGEVLLLKTSDGAYLLPPHRDLREGDELRADGYIMQPKEGAEIPGFDYEGRKILPALRVTMAQDAEGKPVYRGHGGKPRKGGKPKKSGGKPHK